MKVGIFGVGAVGGHVAVRLQAAGHVDLSLLVREQQRARIAAHGMALRTDERSYAVRPTRVFSDPAALEPQDILIVGLKASSLSDNAAILRNALKPDGVVVFLVNGVPWWWTYGREASPRPLPCLDPDGRLWQQVGPERVLGCVVHSSNEVGADGVIINRGKNLYVLGEPDGSQSQRLTALGNLFTQSDIPIRVSTDIHLEIWRKLLANAPGSPVSALTRLSSGPRNGDPHINGLMLRLRAEMIEIGLALGLPLTSDDRPLPQSAADVRPSMLQDSLLHRPMEVEAILGQAQQFARERNVDSPVLDTVITLLRGLDLANRIEVQRAGEPHHA